MSAASTPLPPSARDFDLYSRVVIDGASTRTAAAEFRLSQTRVRQVVSRVVEWLATTLPQDAVLDDDARLRFGKHLAADRLENLYRDAMTDWRTTKQPKFAGLAIRVIVAQAKIPAFAGTLECLAADNVVPSGPDGTEAERVTHTELIPPPPRDCSPPPHVNATNAVRPSVKQTPTPRAAEACENLPPATRAARSAFLAPAHLSDIQADDSPITEIKITPETLGMSTKKTFSRRDRRRLRKALSK